ncbi:trypsin-like peptidase domain-containing protein [Thermoproteota archaeon]
MSSRTLKLITVVAVIVVVFSAFNAYLILDNIHNQEQITTQTKRINELETSLEEFSSQNEQLEKLQVVLDAQEERLGELQMAVSDVVVQDERIDAQEEQIRELQVTVNQIKEDFAKATSSMSTISDQINSLNQSTYASLSDLTTKVESIEDLISDISGLEELVDQLIRQTPTDVYEVSFKSVVVIRTPVGQGSGFLFDTSNIIVTNYHVVEDETDIEIEFFDRTRTQATVIGSDAYSDITVLAVSSAPLESQPMSLSDQPIGIGQQVVAIGNPLGLTESLSVGYISQVNRNLDLYPIIVPVLQLDLTIAPGSSGGPLLDLHGNIVGITNAGTEVGFNFAVPLEILKRVIPALIEEGEYFHPLIGVNLLVLSPEVVTSLNIINVDNYQTGLLILEVVTDSPAEQVGLRPAINGSQGLTAMDIILSIDGNPTLIAEDLTAYMEIEVSPGQTVSLTLWRSGITESVSIISTERPSYIG